MQSPPNVAFNGGGEPTEITRSGGGFFTLNSAYLGAAWSDSLTVTVEGFASGTSVGMETFPANTTGSTLVTFQSLANVDRVVFTTHGDPAGGQFVLDNLTYTLIQSHAITAVPPSNGGLICTPNPVPEGGTTTCTATPNAGYNLAEFTGCTRVGTTNTCQLTNVTAAATVSATFAPKPTSATAVPTLSQWALALLGMLAAGLGLNAQRRKARV